MAHPAAAPSPVPWEETSVTQSYLLRRLSLTDCVLLLTGGVIGSGIFLTAAPIASAVRTPFMFFSIWLVGGALSLFACFAFGEMGAMFPEAGGQYVYIREAFGEFPAFIYGWLTASVVQSGSVAAVAVAFADYFGVIVPGASARAIMLRLGPWTLTRADLVAVAAIILLTAVNVAGVRIGTLLINTATWAKFAAIGAFVLLGLTFGHGHWSHLTVSLPALQPSSLGNIISAFGVALIAVFWTMDGWVFISWVAGEVKEPQRTIPRAMTWGMLLVILVYLLINAVYLYALPIPQIAQKEAIAEAATVALFSSRAAWWLSAMIALSCFGCLSCNILSGARVPYAMARDGLFFTAMGRLHPRYRTPAFSLVTLSVWAIVLALSGSFDQLYTYVIFMLILSYVAAVIGLFVLRRTRPELPRPYRCTGYPYLPALYVFFAGAWALNALVTRPKETMIGLAIVAAGAPIYFVSRRRMSAR
jgi:basic amino acid/polyamine antiporter, APA family